MAYNQHKSVHCEKLHLFNLNSNNMARCGKGNINFVKVKNVCFNFLLYKPGCVFKLNLIIRLQKLPVFFPRALFFFFLTDKYGFRSSYNVFFRRWKVCYDTRCSHV